MKKKYFIICAILTLIIITLFAPNFVSANTDETLGDKGILYYGLGCPHCAKVENFLEKNNLTDKIIKKEIYHNSQNANEFNKVCENEGINLINRGVPFLFADNKCFIGDKQIINYFQKQNIDSNNQNQNGKTDNKKLTIPVLVGAALVDAINPCAFAVLLILMMTIIATSDKKGALFSGLAFSASIFISSLFMTGCISKTNKITNPDKTDIFNPLILKQYTENLSLEDGYNTIIPFIKKWSSDALLTTYVTNIPNSSQNYNSNLYTFDSISLKKQ